MADDQQRRPLAVRGAIVLIRRGVIEGIGCRIALGGKLDLLCDGDIAILDLNVAGPPKHFVGAGLQV